MQTIQVNRKGAGRVRDGHPWIFASDLLHRGQAQPGDAVAVIDERGAVLGVAHFSSQSQIALRMLTRRKEPADREFYLRRLRQAIDHRKRVVENSTACRLVFSEADLLPGLIVDSYGEVEDSRPYLVIQTLNQGMDRARDLIVGCLIELLEPHGILARNDASVRKLEGLETEVAVLHGEIPDQVRVEMNGLRLAADLKRGQKTGVYLDQRENYLAAARYAPSGGRVLDCFTSTGGFALHLAKKVDSVDAVDSSELALGLASANAAANGISNIGFRQADVFDYLSGRSGSGRYSMIVLDPPAFAKSRKQVEDAARGYKDINLRALKLLEPGGVLVTCSCSHHMDEGTLLQVVAEAALDAGKTIRVLERRTQASDHPILLTVPETLYLKCLILQVVEP